VFVITNEMIRRSGATSIPEVLRMAPGVNVAKINSNTWAVTIRGFNSQYANKLLVQIDGRSVYTPFFNGVIWAAQDVLLEDVERIEVIRGPGGTIWGANAVNGIVNIITKKAGETQGAYAQAGAGTYERGFVNLRYGGQIGNDVDYRIYGKWFERGTGIPPFGTPFDDWRASRGGFRMDWDPGRTGEDRFTLQGDSYDTAAGLREFQPTTTFPFSTLIDSDRGFRGSNVLARWTHTIDDQREWQLQTFYDYTQIDDFQRSGLFDRRDTIDVDFQYRLPWGERQKIVWGAGYRSYSDHDSFSGLPFSSAIPSHQDIRLFSWFLQDEITLVPDRWSATLGCKFLHNTYTHFEYQPAARLLYTPDERHSLWASVSRAVRIPSRFEETAILTTAPPFPAPVFAQLQGNSALVAESVIAWETGYRTQPTDEFSWDLAFFFNQYENLVGLNAGVPQFSPPGLIIPLVFANNNRAQSYGFELAANLDVTESWKLRTAYSFLRLEMLGKASQAEGLAPFNQVYLQSSHTLGNGIEMDLIGRYTDTLSATNIPAYFAGDVRLGWHYRPGVELFLVGRNLFDNGHREFANSDSGITTGVRSEVYGGVTIRR
jgi:iron complex outermembrane receptor protein